MKQIILLGCLFAQLCASDPIEKEAAAMAKSIAKKTLDRIQKNSWEDFVEQKDKGKTLDPDQIRTQAEEAIKNGRVLDEKNLPPHVNGKIDYPLPAASDIGSIKIPQLGDLVPEVETRDKQALPNVMSKLSIFKEIKKDLEGEKDGDPRSTQIFKGQKLECSQSGMGELLYDCCQSMKGLATTAHLAKCSPEEIALSKLRDEGKCHKVGSYKQKTLGVTREKRRSFCCFSSKLARLFQEEGRRQLGRSWGKAEKPNCKGLTLSEINKINFDQIDLSELFKDFENTNELNSRIESFRNELRESQEI